MQDKPITRVTYLLISKLKLSLNSIVVFAQIGPGRIDMQSARVCGVHADGRWCVSNGLVKRIRCRVGRERCVRTGFRNKGA